MTSSNTSRLESLHSYSTGTRHKNHEGSPKFLQFPPLFVHLANEGETVRSPRGHDDVGEEDDRSHLQIFIRSAPTWIKHCVSAPKNRTGRFFQCQDGYFKRCTWTKSLDLRKGPSWTAALQPPQVQHVRSVKPWRTKAPDQAIVLVLMAVPH